jgi:hypothetical protein
VPTICSVEQAPMASRPRTIAIRCIFRIDYLLLDL